MEENVKLAITGSRGGGTQRMDKTVRYQVSHATDYRASSDLHAQLRALVAQANRYTGLLRTKSGSAWASRTSLSDTSE